MIQTKLAKHSSAVRLVRPWNMPTRTADVPGPAGGGHPYSC